MEKLMTLMLLCNKMTQYLKLLKRKSLFYIMGC